MGLTGTIPVVFRQGNDTVSTMATVGQPLSAVRCSARDSTAGLQAASCIARALNPYEAIYTATAQPIPLILLLPAPQVAAQAGQYIKYQCRKGECGTCAVRVDGQWIRTCSVAVPFVPAGQSYEVRGEWEEGLG